MLGVCLMDAKVNFISAQVMHEVQYCNIKLKTKYRPPPVSSKKYG